MNTTLATSWVVAGTAQRSRPLPRPSQGSLVALQAPIRSQPAAWPTKSCSAAAAAVQRQRRQQLAALQVEAPTEGGHLWLLGSIRDIICAIAIHRACHVCCVGLPPALPHPTAHFAAPPRLQPCLLRRPGSCSLSLRPKRREAWRSRCSTRQTSGGGCATPCWCVGRCLPISVAAPGGPSSAGLLALTIWCRWGGPARSTQAELTT